MQSKEGLNNKHKDRTLRVGDDAVGWWSHLPGVIIFWHFAANYLHVVVQEHWKGGGEQHPRMCGRGKDKIVSCCCWWCYMLLCHDRDRTKAGWCTLVSSNNCCRYIPSLQRRNLKSNCEFTGYHRTSSCITYSCGSLMVVAQIPVSCIEPLLSPSTHSEEGLCFSQTSFKLFLVGKWFLSIH